MTRSRVLVDGSLSDFVRAAAAPGPVPGSGSVAAAVGALGAGLASMALRSARGEGPADGLADDEAGLMTALLERVDGDAEAYGRYLEARGGKGDLAAAIERSIAVPREIAECSLAALERLEAGVASVRPRLQSEVMTAAQALRAAVEGAAFTACANLPGLADPSARARQRAQLDALCGRAGELVRALHEHLVPRTT